MSDFLDYISQFLPILIGIGIMLLLRSIKSSRNSIRIEIGKSYIAVSRAKSENVDAVSPEDALRSCFEKEATERLIVEGGFGDKMRKRDLGKLAFGRLGMITSDGLRKMHSCKAIARDKRLVVIVRNEREFLDKIRTFGRSGGLLLGYMIDCRVELLSR